MKRSDNVEDIYPLSPLQQGMLFHALYDPESEVYFEQLSCTLRGDLDTDALRRAWQTVIDRHTILRTAFFWERRDKPLQVVRRKASLPWQQQDWRGLSTLEQEDRFKAYLEEDRGLGFELSKAPLMRVALIQLAEDRHYLVWSHHHILLDGWSVALVMNEVFALYEAFSRGRQADLGSSHPYREYIGWLLGQDMSKAESFWRQALKGFREPTPLAVDSARGSLPDGRESYGEQETGLSLGATADLQLLANRHHLTLNTLVQGAWALLLGCYSGEQDVLFGSVVSGRPASLEGVETMIGLFLNTLPVRARISPDRPALSWLRELQEQQVELRQYEYSPLVDVQGWSEVPRGRPLFESLMVFENYPIEESLEQEDASLRVDITDLFERANYPLTVFATPGDSLSLQIVYDCHRFDAPTISRMLEHLRTLLEAIAANPERRLRDLSALTRSERRQVLEEWNRTGADYPSDKCIHELFEDQVERTPDLVAVQFGGEGLTYRELNARANQLARHLQKLGVGPEALVGVCLERSTEMMVGLLGILKAGGAYVPLDPSYPKQRLAFILKDTAVPVLLTTRQLLENLPGHQARAVCLDTDWEAIARESDANPRGGATADNPAYVIYTSGSTGTPKGVVGLHRGAINRFEWMWETYPFEAGEACCQKTSLNFLDSLWEFFGPTLRGIRLVIIPDEQVKDPHLLIETLSENGITRLVVVPSLLRVILDSRADLQGALPRLKYLVTSGEALPAELLQRFRQQMPESLLLNLYGMSEASADSTCYDSSKGEPVATVPIGRPIFNTRAYLLNTYFEPVPVGVPGDLYVGGVGLARGYLNRPDLTAEKFIPDPFGDQPGARLYRTGDLARFLRDGQIEFVGRADHQVKIRGFRVELGEVEAALREHESIRQCVVVAREETPGDRRLVAYVVAQDPSAYDGGELRDYLKGALPAYMLPSAFVPLEALPLTPNGKIDRLALPAPRRAGGEWEAGYVAPRSPVEEVLAEIWAEVLRVDRVGAHDNFFELGGHSLIATQVVSRVYETFQSRLPLRKVFEEPTVAGLATALLDSGDRRKIERTAELLLEVAQLSDEEAERLLEEKLCQVSEGGRNE
ncbi:MAG TPA: amino acid adenylation domain-containing protein [Blastocatellia bacterium]|nr:amino acid adenylation domain-containing protein [Blastocatellia bacterium]